MAEKLSSPPNYDPHWDVAPIGEAKESGGEHSAFNEATAFIESHIERTPKGRYGIRLDNGDLLGIGEYLASNAFFKGWGLTVEEIRSIHARFLPQAREGQLSDSQPVTLFEDSDFETDNKVTGEPASTDATPGAYVRLSDRANAIDGVMQVYNQESRTRGAEKQLEKADSAFRRHNDHPDNLVKGMQQKTARMSEVAMKHIDTLAAVDAMRRLGFNESEIQENRRALRDELRSQYGPDVTVPNKNGKNVAAEKRKDLVDRVSKTADNARKSVQ